MKTVVIISHDNNLIYENLFALINTAIFYSSILNNNKNKNKTLLFSFSVSCYYYLSRVLVSHVLVFDQPAYTANLSAD